MKNALKTTVIIFALMFTSIQLFAQDSFNLKYNFEKGKNYFMRTNMTSESTQNMMGQETSSKAESKTKMKLEIANATPAQIEFITSFDSVYSKSTNPMGGEDIVNNGEALVGKKTKMVYDIYGKKISKVVIDQVQSNGLDGSGSGSSLFLQLSDKPVKVGDVWNTSGVDTNKVGEDGKIITKGDYELKLEGKEKYNGADCLKVTFKGTMKIEGSMTQSGYSIVIEGTSKTSGYFYFDIAKGLPLLNDSTTDMNMTIAVPDQNMTIPMTQTMKTKVTLTEN